MRERLAKLWRDRSLKDVFFLTLTQFSTLMIPLITFPWAVRVLKPENYGNYAFGLAIIQYFLIFVDFGFQFTASRRIIELADDQDRLDRYFWTVQWSKMLLAAASLAIVALMAMLSSRIGAAVPVILASTPLLFASVLQSTWFFLGRGMLTKPSLITVAVRLVFTIPVFVLVRHPGDEWLLALLNSGGLFFGGVASCVLIYRAGWIKRFHVARWSDMREAYVDAYHLFIAQGAVSLYAASNSIILGLVNVQTQVAYFTASDRLRTVSMIPIVPITNAYFGRVAGGLRHDPDEVAPLLRRITQITCAVMGVVSVALFVLAPWIVRFALGPDFGACVPVLRVLACIPVIVAANSILGNLVMINLGLKKQFSGILVLCGGLNVVVLAVLGHRLGAVGAALSLALTEALVTLLFWLYLRRRGIDVFAGRLTLRTATPPDVVPRV